MQAIFTKVLPATNHKPTRIKAFTDSKFTVIKSVHSRDMPDFGNSDMQHYHVASLLCSKLDWKGRLVIGHTKQGCVFVFDMASPL